jgi:hypothetical protein
VAVITQVSERLKAKALDQVQQQSSFTGSSLSHPITLSSTSSPSLHSQQPIVFILTSYITVTITYLLSLQGLLLKGFFLLAFFL